MNIIHRDAYPMLQASGNATVCPICRNLVVVIDGRIQHHKETHEANWCKATGTKA